MQENGRQRAAKIDRQYHAAFDPFLFRKRWMGIVGLVVGVIYSAWIFSSVGALHVTTGNLSKPHFAWNKTGCENCHLQNIPIRKDAWGGERIENIALNNKQCNGTCHAVTGHFESQTKNGIVATESCSTCHREHQGFDKSLVEVLNKDCTRCHANLSAVALRSEGKKSITNFSKTEGHPPFASLGNDPGTIRFSHIQHMRPGQPKSPRGADAKKLDMIPERFQARYNRVDSNKQIILVCSDCHSRDVDLKGYEGLEMVKEKSESFSPLAVQSSSHLLYKPIEFDKHCAACHDLDGVPHGLDRAQTSQAINAMLPIMQLEHFRDQPANEEDIKGRDARLRALLGDGSNACKKCHQLVESATRIVAPSNLNKKWLRDASFSHGAHLMVSCIECHAAANMESNEVFDREREGNNKSLEEASKVMIPGIAKCRECHIQDAESRSQAIGKDKHIASADCVDCHRYHTDSPKDLAKHGTVPLGEIHRDIRIGASLNEANLYPQLFHLRNNEMP